MNHETILDSLGRLPEDVIESVDAVRKRKKINPAWLKWGALAACLCVVLLTLPLLRQTAPTPSVNGDKFSPSPGSSVPNEDPADGGGPADPAPDAPADTPDSAEPGEPRPYLTVDGRDYYTASYSFVSETLPEGFAYAGRFENGDRYYTNPDMPEWIYVFRLYYNRNRRDPETNKLDSGDEYGYIKYVDVRLSGRDLLCYKGEYYISLASARYRYYEGYQDITEEYYNAMARAFGGTRVEENPRYSFELIGQTTFAGFETIPEGDLACNFGVRNVYESGVTDLLLVSNAWVDGKKVCRGYDVYVRYDCPLADSDSK